MLQILPKKDATARSRCIKYLAAPVVIDRSIATNHPTLIDSVRSNAKQQCKLLNQIRCGGQIISMTFEEPALFVFDVGDVIAS